jgi:hypothetical protein
MEPKNTPLDDRAFSFLRINERQAKPRKRGVTEIRGPYYTHGKTLPGGYP